MHRLGHSLSFMAIGMFRISKILLDGAFTVFVASYSGEGSYCQGDSDDFPPGTTEEASRCSQSQQHGRNPCFQTKTTLIVFPPSMSKLMRCSECNVFFVLVLYTSHIARCSDM